MKQLLKSLIFSPNHKRFNTFKLKFSGFFSERDELFDNAFRLIDDYQVEFGVFPSTEAIQRELERTGESILLAYVVGVINDPQILVIEDDSEFISRCRQLVTVNFEIDVLTEIGSFQTSLSLLKDKSPVMVSERIDEHVSKLFRARDKAQFSGAKTSSVLWGNSAAEETISLYDDILHEKESGNYLFYSLGLKGFEDVMFKKGDLAFIAGFTSHGKSVLLRFIVYRMLVYYGLNCAFFTFEMSYTLCRTLFIILHANNKEIFPGSPVIAWKKFESGLLTGEERDFLFNVAQKDFFNNESYGTLYVDQPQQTGGMTSHDLQAKLTELETTVMPVNVVALDSWYLMNPSTNKKYDQRKRDDYNALVKTLKNMALTHKDRSGALEPYLMLTPTQINRDGLDECLKAGGVYSIRAIKDYSEVETSADLILTSLLTDEMRGTSQLRIQNLKNRDGRVVPDPIDVLADLTSSFWISQVDVRTKEDTVEALKSLGI